MIKNERNNPAFLIVLIYLLIGLLWVLFSDRIVYQFSDRNARMILHTAKGWFFVVFSATLLYYLINRYVTQLAESRLTSHASDERLRMALTASRMGVWEWDLRTDLVVWSPEVYEIVGLKDFDGVFASFACLLHPEDAERTVSAVQKALAERVEYADEFRIIRPDSGEIRWLANLGQGRYDADGSPLSVLGTVRDITVEKTTQNALKASEERLRMLLQGVNVGFWDWDLKSGLAYLSPEYFDIVEYRAEDVVPDLVFFKALVHPADRDRVQATMDGHLKGATPDSNIEYRIITGNGAVKWISSRGKVIARDQNGVPLRMLGTLIDITERKQAEVKLIELNDKLRTLTLRLQTVQEQERLSIARDIHDEIGQQLTALKLDIAWLGHRLQSSGDEIDERLKGMGHCLDLLVGSVQRIAADLRPPLLDNLGLAAAIEWQVAEFTRRSGIECILMLNEDADPDNQQTATSIVRIVQEALTNIIRHAGASEVDISLCKTADGLLLEISDNGRGISEEEIAAQDSYGLMGMQERARLCGGELAIDGSPDGGTRLRMTIPYAERDARL